MTYPPDLRQFVEGAVASGQYCSEEELLISALRVLHAMSAEHDALRNDIAKGIAQADRGECRPLDMMAIKKTLQSEWRSKRSS